MTIFNFITTILESAMKSSPNASLKNTEQKGKEIENLREEVWSKAYVSYLPPPETVPEEEQELWDMSELKWKN